MENIEVGEFVRTKRGIAKILEVKTVQLKMYDKHDVAYLIDKCPRMYITETAFIKHSKNIIDIIEVGDYVNGEKVVEIHKDIEYPIIYLDHWEDYIFNDEIDKVVTKEQFAQMEYKVGE